MDAQSTKVTNQKQQVGASEGTLKRPARAERVRWLLVDFLDQRFEMISGRAEGKTLGRSLPDIGNARVQLHWFGREI